MKRKVTYIAVDGKEFDSANECTQYEEKICNLVEVQKAMDIISDFCAERDCTECPFAGKNLECHFRTYSPGNWVFPKNGTV